jgi:hypothetical protein
MHRRVLTAASLLAVAAAAGSGAGIASGAAATHVSVTPKTVAAGGALTVRVSGAHGRRCVLSVRSAKPGSRAIITRKLSAGRTTVTIAAKSTAGARIAAVRCGSHHATTRFRVARADAQGFVPGSLGAQAKPAGGQRGGADYPNSRIADIALSKLGQNLYTAGDIDHGQCKQAVNDWVAEASGRTQVMGVDYHDNYARNGGTQVGRDDAIKGDVIQLDNPKDSANYYRGMHTAVVISHARGENAFDVVDSNFQLDDIVRHHAYDPFAAAQRYGLRVTIWRMGMPDGTPPPPPPPPPPPTAKHVETTGGSSHTWTNYTNAGGEQGPSIPSNATIEIACKLEGFRVSDGNTWWYRLASSPWDGKYYASADGFYNNGQTSGSLHGTPFVDGSVPDC